MTLSLLLDVWYRPAAAAGGDRWQVEPGRVRTLALPAGARLHVTQGRAWITEPNDEDDHFVDAGAVHRLRRGGLVVVQAEGRQPLMLRLLA